MNKKEYIILFILIILLALGIYFYFSRNAILEPLENACPQDAQICPDGSSVVRTGANCEFAECPVVEEKTSQVETEKAVYIKDWKIYQNESYKYEIQYPDYWKVGDKPIKNNFVSFIDGIPSEENPDTIEFSVKVITDKKYSSIESFIKEQDAARATAWEGKSSVSVRASERIKINGLDAVRREIYYNAAGFPGIETFILNGGAIYSLSIDLYVGEIVLGRSRLYDKVIGTFRFNQ